MSQKLDNDLDPLKQRGDGWTVVDLGVRVANPKWMSVARYDDDPPPIEEQED